MLFQELPDHLARMALFKVNTGCRDREVCSLKWDDEVKDLRMLPIGVADDPIQS
jgi:integrase